VKAMFYVFWWVYKDSFGTKSDKIVLECKMCHIPDVFPKARHWKDFDQQYTVFMTLDLKGTT